MRTTLQDLSPAALVSAIEENSIEGEKAHARWPGLELRDGPAVEWTLTGVPCFVFNNVLRVRTTPANAEAIISEVLAGARARQVPLAWRIGPSTRPADLGQRLAASGFVYAGTLPGMAADLAALDEGLPQPPNLTFERVSEMETLKTWCRVMASVNEFADFAGPWFEMLRAGGLGPDAPWQHYLAYLEGTPVATSSLFLGAGVAGIHNVATIPQARQQGIGTAATLASLREARRQGYRIGVLFASDMAVGLYRKLGFREYCRASLYLSGDY